MTTTPRFGMTNVNGTDLVGAFPATYDANLAIADAAMMYSEGTFVRRPAAGTAGRLYRATDVLDGGSNGTLYFDNGTSWDPAAPAYIGEIRMFARTLPPLWLPGDTSVLRTTYAALFSEIGTTFGAADGSHFNTPPLAGRSVIGAGSGSGLTSRSLGAMGGEERHTLTRAELPDYALPVTDPGHVNPPAGGGPTSFLGDSGATTGWALAPTGDRQITQSGATGSARTGISVASGGSGAAMNNMQPFAVVTFGIYAGA